MNGVYAVGYFLFSLFFGLVTFVLWVRLALRYFHVSTLHPASQWVYQLTEPVITPIRSAFHAAGKQQGRYDWPCFALLYAIEIIKFALIAMLFLKASFPWVLIIFYPLVDMLVQALNILFYAIIIRVILSWVNPTWRSPLADLLLMVTEPMLSAVRARIPPIAGLDFSPLVILVLIKVITLFISASLPINFI